MSNLRTFAFFGLFLLTFSAIGCGGGLGSYGGTQCVDYQGFPTDCDAPGAVLVKPDAPVTPIPEAGWAGSSRGTEVVAAFGDRVTFEAAEPHVMLVHGEPAPAVRATSDGRLFYRDAPVGYVAHVRTGLDEIGVAMVSADGFLLEVTSEIDGRGLVATDQRLELIAPGAALLATESALASGLSIARMD